MMSGVSQSKRELIYNREKLMLTMKNFSPNNGLVYNRLPCAAVVCSQFEYFKGVTKTSLRDYLLVSPLPSIPVTLASSLAENPVSQRITWLLVVFRQFRVVLSVFWAVMFYLDNLRVLHKFHQQKLTLRCPPRESLWMDTVSIRPGR